MRYRFYTADVFTTELFGGNQLAVFPDASGLRTQTMQSVARELNLSETVFVLPPDDPGHTRKLRIFTPGVELPFAGHPTVGTAFVLAHFGEIPLTGDTTPIVLEEGVGPIRVSIRRRNGQLDSATLTAARLPEKGPEPPSSAELASVLSLDERDVLTGRDRPEAFSCGVPFLFVPVRDRDALARATTDLARWRDVLGAYWAPHLFIFCREDARFRARMFAPAMGIAEDPATGAAATAFAGYLAARDAAGTDTLRWVVEQGIEMGRPSRIEVEADRDEAGLTAVRVSGSSVIVSEGEMDIPARRAVSDDPRTD